MRVWFTGCFFPGHFGYLFIRVLLDEFVDAHPASSHTDDEFSDLDSGVNTACSEEVPTISESHNTDLAFRRVNVAREHLIEKVTLDVMVQSLLHVTFGGGMCCVFFRLLCS